MTPQRSYFIYLFIFLILPVISIGLLGCSFSTNFKTCTWLKIGRKGLGDLGRPPNAICRWTNTVWFVAIHFNASPPFSSRSTQALPQEGTIA